jgi:tRNA nucleotidyltransferase/poly(A) polymerase
VTVEGREDIRKIVSRKTNFADSGLRGNARKRLARLVSEPDLVALDRMAAGRGERVWIVGGALRDVLMQRDVAEIDVAVNGDAGALARELELAGRGRAVLLSGERTPRVFRVAGGGRTFDVAELEGGSTGVDLARRDFSVNAMAVEVRTSALIDPYGGVADLSRRRLRMVSAKNLHDDPLRPLRAARLFATHDLRPDRATSRESRTAAPALGRVPGERVQAELAKLLEAPRPARALSWAATAGLLGPAFRAPIPDSRWRRIARSAAVLDSDAVVRLSPDRRRRLRLAFLLGRAGLSPREAAALLRRARWSSVEAGEVSRLLELVMAAPDAGRGEDSAWRWILDAGELADDALRLLPLLRPRARAGAVRLRARLARRGPIPDVRGADVIEWLGIPPGREVGQLLDAVRVEGLARRVRTREEARKWLLTERRDLPDS